MNRYADGLWVLQYHIHKGWGTEIVLDNKSTSGYPFDDGHSITRAIKRFSRTEQMSETLTEEYLDASKVKAHLSPVNLLVW